MENKRAERLRAARSKAGFTSASDAAQAFGWGEAGYRHHENGTRNFGLDAAKKYGRAFRVKPGWLLCMEGIDEKPVQEIETSDTLRVGGAVAAGVWREDDGDFEVIEIDTPAHVSNAKRFGYTVEGRSMDLFYEHGAVLDCISIFTNGVKPESGDHVIVERRKADGLRERTVKEMVEREGRYFLVPRSTRPEFQDEIEIGAPDANVLEDSDGVQVIGFVVTAIQPRALRLLDRLGKVRKVT